MKKIKWLFKQLFPLNYQSLEIRKDGKRVLTLWKMWFNHSYAIKRFIVLEEQI